MTGIRRASRTNGEGTRARILEAAVRRFAGASYDTVSLREIAGDVGVDVAYVHRSFGSKEALFAQALRAASGPDVMDGLERRGGPHEAGDFAGELVSRLAEKSRNRPYPGIDPLDIMMHSLASPKAAAILREKARKDFLAPMSQRLDEDGDLRAAMVLALLIGTGIARDLLALDALADPGNAARIPRLLEAAITALIDADGPKEK